ncbi:helix-turn-helix domain-containing protein [Pseudonocardia lacus]|uniref:helix-turn-helix domain-containing protein n=1 Tax=Pseudonocardia lacus TaxID=2835865 RepID=UPI001BDCDC81|nr:XRE family transcriptional regulator [Pseudonocardia lacus]
MTDPLSSSLATALQAARRSRDLSAGALAERSGVSRAMIGKIERGTAQPTAALLGRLAGALGMTLSELVARAEDGADAGHGRLARRADQPVWTDPGTGYRRRAVSPAPGGPIELVEVHLPGGAEVAFPPDTYTSVHHQIWVLDGRLDFHEGAVVHRMATGDCLQLGPPQPCRYVNPTAAECRYLVALTRRQV